MHHRALEAYVAERAPQVVGSFASDVRILDVGCGDMPYRKFFEGGPRAVTYYEGADIAGADGLANVSIDPATQAIGAPSDRYDLVVSFQVLEHSSHPLTLLRECRRVLKPGGRLFATLPFFFEYHAVPRDFRRWTHEGIKEDLLDCGFEDVTVDPVETDLHSLMVVNELYLARMFGYVVTKPLFLALNVAALAARRLRTPQHRIVPLTLGVTARRAG
ncbi:MAG TPA: methyltransferase domain-containing protein [Polyangia bacterium]|nr:methyltransferase domain-containing protein [Polyangia bacterium]